MRGFSARRIAPPDSIVIIVQSEIGAVLRVFHNEPRSNLRVGTDDILHSAG